MAFWSNVDQKRLRVRGGQTRVKAKGVPGKGQPVYSIATVVLYISF